MRRGTTKSVTWKLLVGSLAAGAALPLAGLAPGSTAGASPLAKATASRLVAHTSPVFPTASGAFGQPATLKFPNAAPPKTLESKVLHQGTGPALRKGDLLIANYVGQIWKGKVFDSSYVRKVPLGIGIGIGQVIPGWDKTLVGARVGSRMLLVIPPADGYGATGDAGAGIKGTDTLVFVIDLLAAYDKGSRAGVSDRALAHGARGVTVAGKVGAAPTITVAKGTKQPSKEITTVLDKGSGPKVAAGLVVVDFALANWSGKVLESTWTAGTPYGATIGVSSQPSSLDALIGLPIGSRVLLETPKTSAGGPYAVVLDLVAQPKLAKLAK